MVIIELILDTNARVSEGLDVYASLGYMSNEYKELGPNVTFDKNNEIKRTPEYSGQIGFNYRAPVNSTDTIIVSADYSHQDEYYAGVNNSPAELAEETDLVYAAISYEGDDGRWMVTAACENCTDEEYHTSTLDFGVLGFATQYPGKPRQYSLALKVAF